MRIPFKLWIVWLVFASPLLHAASVTSIGDVVVTGSTRPVLFEDPTIGKALVFTNQGVLRGEMFSSTQQQVLLYPAFVPGTSDIVVSTHDFLLRLSGNGAQVFASQYFPVSLYGVTIAADGTIYASSGNASIVELSSSGQYVRSHSTAPYYSSAAIDLAADQCTVYVVRGTTLGKANVCTGEVFPPLTTSLPYNSTDLRVLADGTILVASGFSMVRFSPDGTLLRTYATPASWLALDIDGHSVWISSAGLSKFDLDTGSVTLGPIPMDIEVYGLAVYGEPRAAVVAAIPTVSPIALFALAMTLAAIGVIILRRQ